MGTLCCPIMTPCWLTHLIGPLVHFLKGRCMVPAFREVASFDPLPPGRRATTCYNIPNAESMFHAVALILSVFHDASV